MEENIKNELKPVQIKTEYCGSLAQDNDMTILELICEILSKELDNLFNSIESNVKNYSKLNV